MKKLKLVAIVIMFIPLILKAEENDLTCSRGGTYIHLVNGMFNTKSPILALARIRDLSIQKSTKIDAHTYLEWGHTHNWGDPLLIADILEAGLQKAQEQEKLGDQIFKPNGETYLEVLSIVADAHGELLEKRKESPNYVIRRNDVQTKLNSALESKLNQGLKTIVVSHSQGNFFANDAYTQIFSNENFKKYERVFGNLQLASPTSGRSAPNSIQIKADQDLVVNGNIIGQNGTHSLSLNLVPYFFRDPSGHGLIPIYLSSDIYGYDQAQDLRLPMSEIFTNGLIQIAKNMAPNCCINSDNIIDLSDNVFDRHPNGNGYVSVGANVSENVYVSEDSLVCKMATISGKSSLWNSIVSGNVTIDNSALEKSDILGLGSDGVKILGEVAESNPNGTPEESLIGLGMRISNIKIEGNVEIRGNHYIHANGGFGKGSIRGIGKKTFLTNSLSSSQGVVFRSAGENYPLEILDSNILNVLSIAGARISNSTLSGNKTIINNSEIVDSSIDQCEVSKWNPNKARSSSKILNSDLTGYSSAGVHTLSQPYPSNFMRRCRVTDSAITSATVVNSSLSGADILTTPIKWSLIGASNIVGGTVTNSDLRETVSSFSVLTNTKSTGGMNIVNSTSRDSTLGSGSIKGNSLISNSSAEGIVKNSSIQNGSSASGTVINSSVLNGSSAGGFIENSTIDDESSVSGGTVTGGATLKRSGVAGHSFVSGAYVTDSDIFDSIALGSTITNSSVIQNSTLDGGVIDNSKVLNKSLVEGLTEITGDSTVSGTYLSSAIIQNKAELYGSMIYDSVVNDSRVIDSTVEEMSRVINKSSVTESIITGGAVISNSDISNITLSESKSGKICDGFQDTDQDDYCVAGKPLN